MEIDLLTALNTLCHEGEKSSAEEKDSALNAGKENMKTTFSSRPPPSSSNLRFYCGGRHFCVCVCVCACVHARVCEYKCVVSNVNGNVYV